MKVKLAEALLRRKELQEKVDQLKPIRLENLFEAKVTRQSVSDSIDEARSVIPKITFNQISAGYDYYAKQLRLIDAAIQQANWTTEIEVSDTMKDHEDKTAVKA